MADSMEFGVLLCVAAVLTILGLPVPIASVVIANQNMEDSCQSMDSIGLSLSSWLLGAGIVGLVLILSLATLVIMFSCHPNAAGVTTIALMIFNALFQMIYTTIGAVVLFRSNMDCLNNGTDLGVMSLVVLIFYWISILTSCCSSKSKSNSD